MYNVRWNPTVVLADVVSKLCRFEVLHVMMPKTKDEFKQVEPSEVFREVQAACALRSDVLQLLSENTHFDANFRDGPLAADIFERMPVFTKNASARVVLYGLNGPGTHFISTNQRMLSLYLGFISRTPVGCQWPPMTHVVGKPYDVPFEFLLCFPQHARVALPVTAYSLPTNHSMR